PRPPAPSPLSPYTTLFRSQLARVLNDCSRVSGEITSGRRLRSAFVIIELVLAFVLLACAGSLLRSLWRLESASPGFNAENLVTADRKSTRLNSSHVKISYA